MDNIVKHFEQSQVGSFHHLVNTIYAVLCS